MLENNNYICTAKQVEEIVTRLNAKQDKTRDANLDKRFDELQTAIDDNTISAYQTGVKAGQEHTKSSKETLEELERIKNVCLTRDDLVHLKKDFNEMSKDIKGLLKLNTDVNNIKNAWTMGGKAGTWVVKLVLGLTVVLGAIYALKEWIKK